MRMIQTSSMRAALALCLSIALATSARADDALADKIAAVTGTPEFKHSQWGIYVVDRASGDALYERNVDQLFVPASTTKLFSGAAALDALGADYRFETPIYAQGVLDESGLLRGNLILVASGDLSLGGRTDANGHIAFKNTDHTYAGLTSNAELTEPDPLAGLKELASQVSKAGVQRVQGDVLIDDRLFEPALGSGSGPQRITPIKVNDNVIDILVTPGKPGEEAKITWRPMTSSILVDAHVETVTEGAKANVGFRAVGDRRLVVRGQIAADRKLLVLVVEVEDAASFARSLLIEALNEADVVVEASPLGMNRPALLPSPATYAKLKRVGLLESPPFSESLKLILKVSHNLHAGTLPLLMAAREGKRTLAEGMQLERDFLARAGIDVASISFGGAVGGDRADHVTPRATVALLRCMATRPDFPAYLDALPVLGVDGTLASSVKPDSPARGKVQAKTGTLLWPDLLNGNTLLTSKALAGYATTAGGKKLALAMFVNNVHVRDATDRERIGQVLGRLCELIYESQ